jgi:hypothetical protein
LIGQFEFKDVCCTSHFDIDCRETRIDWDNEERRQEIMRRSDENDGEVNNSEVDDNKIINDKDKDS